jgi:hypothetical protein
LLLTAFLTALFAPAVAVAGAGTWFLPSSAFRAGLNGAEFRTDVRLLNSGRATASVLATFLDQATGEVIPAPAFRVGPRSQASFDNILGSLFGRSSSQGAYGPIRFETGGPLAVSVSLNNVNS